MKQLVSRVVEEQLQTKEMNTKEYSPLVGEGELIRKELILQHESYHLSPKTTVNER